MCENEIWKPVVGFEDYYEVSNLGRVKALERHLDSAVSQSGKQRRKERILRGGTAAGGYRNVGFCVKNVETTHLVHQLVMTAFVAPCPPGYEINHIDANKQNNRLDNLEFVSHPENMRHAIENGLIATPRRGLNEAQVTTIKELLSTTTLTQRQIATEFGVSADAIGDINAGRSWQYVGDYQYPIRGKKRL